MALILSRRNGEAVDLYIRDGEELLGSIVVRFDPKHPNLAQLHFSMTKDITILRRELSNRKRNEQPQRSAGDDYNPRSAPTYHGGERDDF